LGPMRVAARIVVARRVTCRLLAVKPAGKKLGLDSRFDPIAVEGLGF